MDDSVRKAESAPSLFPEISGPAPGKPAGTKRAAQASPRLRLAERSQGRLITESLDQRLGADHPVRNVWAFVEQLDLSPLHDRIRAVRGHVGRNANDPRLLVAVRQHRRGLDQGKDPYAPQKGDSLAMIAFRARMGLPEAKAM